MQRGLFITLAALPVAYGIYSATAGDADNKSALTRLIEKYHSYTEQWVDRNAMHTKMVEQAAFDRNLFQSSQGTKMVDLKFPE